MTDITRKVNDQVTNLEDVDKQLIQMMQADEKNTKEIAELGRKLEVVASTPNNTNSNDSD